MKKKLTALTLVSIFIIQTISLLVDFPWKGIIIWGISVFLLGLAAYFTKFLEEKNKGNE
ncbi:MAG: hypothetical protein ACQEWU_21235 [Bacillota bacterium]